MEPFLILDNLTYDGIGNFITSAVEKSEASPLYLLGKAAAYVDVASILGRVSHMEALELRSMILVYASINDNHPFEYFETSQMDFSGSPIKPR